MRVGRENWAPEQPNGSGAGGVGATPAESPIRIVLADDHPIYLAGLRAALDEVHRFTVVGEADDGARALNLARELRPDIVLLAAGVSTPDILETLRTFSESRLPSRLVVLLPFPAPADVTMALRLGAAGVLPRTTSRDQLQHCLNAVRAGQYWVGRGAVADLVEALRRMDGPGRPPTPAGLTHREREIVAALVRGATNRQMAQKFGVSEQTIKNHMSNIFDKLGMSSRLELALYARDHHLLDLFPNGS